MNLLFLVIFGALIGFLASYIMGTGRGILWDIILGIIGSIVGGYIMNFFGQPGVTGFNLYSIIVGVLGAIIVVFLGRLFIGQQHNQ